MEERGERSHKLRKYRILVGITGLNLFEVWARFRRPPLSNLPHPSHIPLNKHLALEFHFFQALALDSIIRLAVWMTFYRCYFRPTKLLAYEAVHSVADP